MMLLFFIEISIWFFQKLCTQHSLISHVFNMGFIHIDYNILIEPSEIIYTIHSQDSVFSSQSEM